jgi:hypothetical protein
MAMKELELYKFMHDNNVENRWDMNGRDHDVIAFIYHFDIPDFTKVIGSGPLDDGGMECRLQGNYICVWMCDICDYYGIDPVKVFGKNPNK